MKLKSTPASEVQRVLRGGAWYEVQRVLRGGAWYDTLRWLRGAARLGGDQHNWIGLRGFRLVRTHKEVKNGT